MKETCCSQCYEGAMFFRDKHVLSKPITLFAVAMQGQRALSLEIGRWLINWPAGFLTALKK